LLVRSLDPNVKVQKRHPRHQPTVYLLATVFWYEHIARVCGNATLPYSLAAREIKLLQCLGRLAHGSPENYTSIRIEIPEKQEPFRFS
jgi:hypothetical protein